MALTEKQIDDLVEAILHGTQEKYVQEMSDLMVDHLAQSFAKLSDEAALQQLAEIFPGQAQTILAKYQDAISDEVHAEVEKTLNESVAADLDQLKKIYGQERADVAEAYFAVGATAHFAALAKSTADQIADIVRRQNILMEQQAEQKWYQVSQDAINAVVLGTKPTEKALADGIVDLMNAGIMVIDYGRNGKATVSNMADVALRRHIVSQVSQVGGQMSLEAMQSYGHEFAITSAHFGARPSHAKWQGLPGCMSGEKTVDGTTYPDFYELTGYMGLRGPNVALGDRLKGVNCRHSMHPFFPGITQLPDREFKEAQAKYGKSSDEYYADLQRQRELERRIRKTKREIVGLERAGLGLESPTYVQKRLVLGKQQCTLNKHCKDNKLVRLYNREKAYGVSSQPRALKNYSYWSRGTRSGYRIEDLSSFERKYRGTTGREVGMAFDKDGNDILFIDGNEGHSIEFTKPNGYKWSDLSFAHTHPDEYGGTFSLSDVFFLADSGILGLHAVCREGTYSLIPNQKTKPRTFVKAYEDAFFDALDKYGKDLISIRRFMHSWLLDNSSKYGFKYSFKRV